jgi:hypothetical protein
MATPDHFPARGAWPDEVLEVREQLRRLWDCARQLRVAWRLALLLNPPSVQESNARAGGRTTGRSTARGELDVFPAHGIASIAQIGDALELTSDQYRIIFEELGIPEEPTLKQLSGRSPFYAVWPHLPLRDQTIGAAIGRTGIQVLGLRKLAIRQVAGCMAERSRAGAGHMSPAPPSAQARRGSSEGRS